LDEEIAETFPIALTEYSSEGMAGAGGGRQSSISRFRTSGLKIRVTAVKQSRSLLKP
jgi:hypothetical protein